MTPRNRSLLLFALGLILVLNPVYVFPNGVPYEEQITYRAERIDRVGETHRKLPTSAVLDCRGPISHRECVQAHRVGYDGRVLVENETRVALEDEETGLYVGYEYVRFDRGYTRPTASVEGGNLVLSYDPVSQKRVLSEYATPFGSLPPLGKRAIRNGSASTTRRFADFDDVEPFVIDEEQRIVNRSGTFYRIDLERKVSDRQFPPWILGVVRIVGVIGGAGLMVFAGRRYPQ